VTDPETRIWRLRGWSGKDLVHNRTYLGDAALDRALAYLEKNPEITRTAASPA
jgi:hypothetical protein